MNFCIKVQVDCDDHLYLFVWEHRYGKLELMYVVQLSELHPASELPFSLDQIKQQVEDRTGKKYEIFRGINYKTPLTEREGAATYFIKPETPRSTVARKTQGPKNRKKPREEPGPEG
uniref:Uncharacterized protein n=1 Tax=Esox lucius TaxID=8010 RepID=A0AAY5K2J8_ESOLU